MMASIHPLKRHCFVAHCRLRVELTYVLKLCSSIDSDPYSEDGTDRSDSTLEAPDIVNECTSERESSDRVPPSRSNSRLCTRSGIWCSPSDPC